MLLHISVISFLVLLSSITLYGFTTIFFPLTSLRTFQMYPVLGYYEYEFSNKTFGVAFSASG